MKAPQPRRSDRQADPSRTIPESFRVSLFEHIESKRRQVPKSYFCPACGTVSARFQNHGSGKGRSNAKCPVCGAVERHRLFWVYFVNAIWPRLPQGTKKLLHVAPEPIFTELLRSCDTVDYLSGDLGMRRAMIKLDLTDIHFPDEQFDVIICLHILEHIPDDRKAMAEMFRVTKPGGFLLVMVPTYGQNTYEDFNVTSPKDRVKHFGQHDHVRKYGMDIADRLSATGFKVTIWPREGQLDAEIVKFIAARRRVIFECRRES